MVMKAHDAVAPRDGALAKVKNSQLFADLRVVARMGSGLVQQGAGRLRKVVEEYCVEFDPRAEMAMIRIPAR
jgi:hypothetical protein